MVCVQLLISQCGTMLPLYLSFTTRDIHMPIQILILVYESIPILIFRYTEIPDTTRTLTAISIMMEIAH